MNRTEAIAVQKEIEEVLRKHGIFYTLQHVRKPDLRFINFSEISIKITGGKYEPMKDSIAIPGPGGY